MNIETREGLFAVMEQIAEEREAAGPIVERLVASGDPIDDIEIPEGWRTAGFAHELSTAADALSEAEPARSLTLQELALVIATSLRDRYPSPVQARLEGNAWREIGWVHCFQSAYTAAFRAYDASQRHFATEAALGHDDGRVMINRAGALVLARRYAEALRVLEEASSIFPSFGDDRRIAMVEMLRAAVYHFRGQLSLAREKLTKLIPIVERLDDPDLLARLYNNVGAACANLGDASAAAAHFHCSRTLHAELGNSVLVEKVDWGLARALLATGAFEKALPILGRLRDLFLTQRLPEDAGEVALDMVEALVATNRIEEARVLTEQVITEFRSANLDQQAVIAVGYLRDLLSTTQQARQAVKHVRSYVQKLKTEPARLFLPLHE